MTDCLCNGEEPHSELDGSISTQLLLKSQFCSAPYQAIPGLPWWRREQLFLGADEPQTDEPCSEVHLALEQSCAQECHGIKRSSSS